MGERMIFLTRFDGTEVVVNSDLIVTVEKIPDTVVTLTAAYRHRVMQGPGVRDSRDLSSSMRVPGSGPVRAPRDGGDET
jgi:Flagellar and Swarming motility proteins